MRLVNAIPEEIASGNALCWKADAELLCWNVMCKKKVKNLDWNDTW